MGQDLRKIIAQNVKRNRIKKGVSRTNLSLQIGKDISYVSKLEKCEINITIDTLNKLIEYFNIKAEDFFKEIIDV